MTSTRRPPGGEAQAADHKPDVVVLHLGLPDMTGIEVLARLHGRLTAPVIVSSARADSSDKVEALDAGADDYVTKPPLGWTSFWPGCAQRCVAARRRRTPTNP